MANQELSEQEQVRRNSMQALRDRGIEPYPAPEYKVTGHSVEIKENFVDGEEKPREVAVAGRIMSRRIMGKASFMEPSGCRRKNTGVRKPRRPLSG